MGETLLLATSGDTIKLWDSNTYAFYQEIPSEGGHVSGLTWNQDGQCLASLSSSGKEIHLSAVRGKSAANIGVMRGFESPSCVSFACRSPHYLAVGSTSGTVTIWNAKSQTKKKEFAPTDRAISKVVFSQSDSHIAAATRKGTLYTLSNVNNLTTGPFKLFENEVVSDLAYSRVKKSLLGCCSESGNVALYDTNANKVQHTFTSAHDSPVAAIAFSPVNELLLVSVGYDKKLSCFNVQTRQHVMTHRSTDPLTSITFLGMGQLVALGTMTGQVLIHDMRSIRSPVASLKAHRAAVTNVLLQPVSKSKSVSSSKTGQRNNNTVTLSVPTQKQSKSCSDTLEERNPKLTPKIETRVDTSLESVFSPVRDTKLINTTPQIQSPEVSVADNLAWINSVTEKADAQSLFSPVLPANNNNNKYFFISPPPPMDVDADNVLSPIRDTTLVRIDSDSCDSSAMQLESSTTKDLINPPLLTITTDLINHSTPQQLTGVSASKLLEVNSEAVSVLKEGNEHKKSPKLSPPRKRPLQSPVTACTPPTLATAVPADAASAFALSSSADEPAGQSCRKDMESKSGSTPKKIPDAKAPRNLEELLAPKALGGQPTQPKNGPLMGLGLPHHDLPAAAGPGVPPLQMELIRNCMQEVLEDFQDETNSRLIHLQYVMTKKFIEQQEKMEQLHRQYSLNEDLMAEVERLQQEVARLQARF